MNDLIECVSQVSCRKKGGNYVKSAPGTKTTTTTTTTLHHVEPCNALYLC